VSCVAQFGGAVGSAAAGAGAVAAGVASAQQVAARLMQQAAPGASTSVPAGVLDVAQPHFEADLEINDFPQHARWKARLKLPVGTDLFYAFLEPQYHSRE